MMDFLLQMEMLASRDPCIVPKADMLRLVTLAGFERTHLAYHQVEAADDPVLVLRDGALKLIGMARSQAHAA